MMHDKPNEEQLQSESSVAEYFQGKIQELLPSNQQGLPSDNWIKTLYFEIDPESRSLTIYFPHLFLAQWFDSKLKDKLKAKIATEIENVQQIYCKTLASKSFFNIFSQYTPDNNYGFNNFLYNDKNYLAYTSAYELTQNCKTKSNPFLLIGPQGTGKTHLLKAIANSLAKKTPEKKILFTDVQEIDSKIKKKFHSQKYLTQYLSEFDYLLLDAIEYLDYYTYLQSEIVSIFDHFLQQEKQMVFACTGRISTQEFLDSKLKSRLESGLLIPVQLPDLEIRLKFLQLQAEEKALSLGQEQLLYLALHYPDFKSLYRISIHLLSQSSLHGLDLGSLEMNEFRQALPRDLQNSTTELNSHRIISLVAEHFRLSPEQLRSGQQDKNTVLARQTAMFLCRRMLGQTYAQIGSVLGGKDHSTVLYSYQKIKKLQKDNKNIKNMLKTLEQSCKQHFVQP